MNESERPAMVSEEIQPVSVPADNRASVHNTLPQVQQGQHQKDIRTAGNEIQEPRAEDGGPYDTKVRLFPTEKVIKGNNYIVYDVDVSESIVHLIAHGCTLSSIASLPGMPTIYQMKSWERKYPEFKERVVIAKLARAEYLADRALMVADQSRFATFQSDKIKTDVAFKIAAALDPDTYGNKTKISGDKDAPVSFLISTGIVRAGDVPGEHLDVKLDRTDPAKATEKKPPKEVESEEVQPDQEEVPGPGRGFGVE